jgi:DNA-binding NtrC family response regulator
MARILVAEHDSLARHFLRTALELGDHRVIEADRGDSAILEITRRELDVVVTEYRLPRLTGVDVIRAAGLLEVHLPCLILAGLGDVDAIVPALEAGAVGIITKPATARQVLLTVARAYERRLLAREAARARLMTALLETWMTGSAEVLGREHAARGRSVPRAAPC